MSSIADIKDFPKILSDLCVCTKTTHGATNNIAINILHRPDA